MPFSNFVSLAVIFIGFVVTDGECHAMALQMHYQ